MSKRRTKAQYGWVDFPVDDQRYTNTREGGMVVKLVVTDDRSYNSSDWTICIGAACLDMFDSSLVSHDLEMFYPSINDEKEGWPSQYMSRTFLACITLGLTGWSGWDEKREEYWKCTFDNLTDEGQALYTQLQKLYKGCDLHLLTYLDT